jgi:hypothetical protein
VRPAPGVGHAAGLASALRLHGVRVVLGLPVSLGGVTVGSLDRLLRPPARVAGRRAPGPCSLPRCGQVHSCHCRGRRQRRRAPLPSCSGRSISGDHRAWRRVFDGARSSGPITAFNNLRRRAVTHSAQVWTGATNLVGRARREGDTPRERVESCNRGGNLRRLNRYGRGWSTPVGDRKCGVLSMSLGG